jgi:DNA-binding transcriptional regulator YiaG
MSQQQKKLPESKEARIQLALQAIKQDVTLTQQRAAAIYKVSKSTLSDRRAGKTF